MLWSGYFRCRSIRDDGTVVAALADETKHDGKEEITLSSAWCGISLEDENFLKVKLISSVVYWESSTVDSASLPFVFASSGDLVESVASIENHIFNILALLVDIIFVLFISMDDVFIFSLFFGVLLKEPSIYLLYQL